jgi:predicted amidohydrolase YtcJ
MHRIIVLLIGAFISLTTAAQPADLILRNGRIWTGAENPVFEQALAIRGNTIVFAGSNAEVKKYMGSNTKVMELEGKLVIPGFNDAHTHFLTGSLGLAQVDLSACKNRAECVAAIARYTKAHPEKTWITGAGWQYGFFAGGMPTRELLDSLVPDRPAFISAYDGHSGWANSQALQQAGINSSTVFKGFGEVIKDAAGQPTGVLTEGAQGLVRKLIAPPTTEEKLNALRTGLQQAARLGVTSIQNASGSEEELALYETLLQRGELTLRSSTAFSVNRNTTETDIEKLIKARQRCNQPQWLKAHAIKFMLDGVIESHTAMMLEPYSDLTPADSDRKTDFAIPLPRYNELVTRLDKAGFQLYTHAIGDRSVREALNAYETATKTNGPQTRRHRIEHIEQVATEDIARFAKLNVLPSMQPIHADPGTIDVWAKAVGEARLPQAFAWASFLKSKARLVFSSDWPACISMDPIRGLHNAVNRLTTEGQPPGGWVPAQRIALHQALLAYTQRGAYASFDEKIKGKIAPGYLADLVVLSQNLFTIAPTDIHTTKVLLTLVDGKVVYEVPR